MIGLGSDILDIRRIEKTLLRFGDRFKKRIFTKYEINKCEKRKLSVECFAKRFAAKEAAAKALGTGFRKNLNFKDISIRNTKYGKPYIKINNKIRNIVMKRFKTKKFNILLSIADEKNHSIAFVILEKI